jgi:hypothetical protein
MKKLKGETYHDNVAIEIFTDIDVAFHDGVVSGLMDTGSFLSKNGGLEQRLGSTETTKSTL